MSLTSDIKEYALDLGYSDVGITTAEAFPDYIADLVERYDMYRFFIEGAIKPLEGADPKKKMPSARSIIAVVYDYAKEAFPERLVGNVGRVYQACAYDAPPNRITGARRQLLLNFLAKNCGQSLYGSMLPARMIGARAGIATYGRNSFSYFKGIGSWGVIIPFLVESELEYDTPTMRVDCPSGCTACIDSCPTKAIYEPMHINPLRCIAYNCYIARDGTNGRTSSYIPPDIREKMGSWIHGCDICQEACPRNKPRLKMRLTPNAYLNQVAAEFDLTRILDLTEEYYQKIIYPLMFNYHKEKKYFQRNAAIALGNTHDTMFVPNLVKAIQDPEPLVRGYTAWALGQIGGKHAKEALELAEKRERAEFALEEIEGALIHV